MNKQISELIQRSGAYIDTSGRWLSVRDIDKILNELIAECVNICVDVALVDSTGKITTPHDAAIAIKSQMTIE